MTPARTKAIERVTGIKKQRPKQVWFYPVASPNQELIQVGTEHVVGAVPIHL